MEFFEAIDSRRSVRAYRPQNIEDEKLSRILECARSAPSAGNLQGYDIFVVRDPAIRKALARASLNQEFVAQAPVALVFCTHAARSARKYGQRGMKLYALQDATIACTYAMLAAQALGLATVWVGAFHDETVHEAIGAPQGMQPVAILPIGYAAEVPERTPRLHADELIHRL